MKKILALVLAMLLVVSLFAACGGKTTEDNSLQAVLDKGELVIGTSPDFPPFENLNDDGSITGIEIDILTKICEKLGVSLIATEMDPRTGRISGENCHDVEKPKRFSERYPDARVERFYSDSLSDAPMAELAERSFLVKKHRLFPWPN